MPARRHENMLESAICVEVDGLAQRRMSLSQQELELIVEQMLDDHAGLGVQTRDERDVDETRLQRALDFVAGGPRDDRHARGNGGELVEQRGERDVLEQVVAADGERA